MRLDSMIFENITSVTAHCIGAFTGGVISSFLICSFVRKKTEELKKELKNLKERREEQEQHISRLFIERNSLYSKICGIFYDRGISLDPIRHYNKSWDDEIEYLKSELEKLLDEKYK